MIRRRVHLTAILAMIWFALIPPALLAQAQPATGTNEGREASTYMKLGLAYWQGDIFSDSSLTRWNVDLFGAGYELTSLNVEVDTYLPWVSFPISGFAIAYRKDAIPSLESGHMFSGTVFHDCDLKVLAVKAGGGAEWGIPSVNFDQEKFDVGADGTVRYRHTYLHRNATAPVISRPNGALYPFLTISLINRPGPLLFELGIRANFIRFRFDEYEVRPGDQVVRAFDEERSMVPYLFGNVGLRLF